MLRAPTGLAWAPNPVGASTPYTVKWTAMSSATGYRLEENVGASWQTVYSGANPQFGVAGRAAGNYPYRVSACRDATCGPVSATVIVPVGGGSCNPAPPASMGVMPQNSTDAQFTVSWAASPSSCVSSYALEELFNSQGEYQLIPLSDTQNQQRSWSPNPAKEVSGTYTYRVRACGGGNCSTYMVGAQVTVSLPVSLATPTNLKACRGTNGSNCVPAGSTLELISGATGASYQIRWDTVDNATSYQYQLETKDHCASNWQNHGWQNVNVAYVGGAGNPAGSQCGLDYRYVVKACAGTNCGLPTTTAVMVWIQKQPLRPAVTEVTYYHTDALGSPVAQTDASGAVIKRTAYRPWGAPADGSYEQGPGYTGHVTDAHTGLSYMQQRYYDPIAGRFLSVDPVPASPESFNRYWYANNNPYKNIDPDGRQACGKDTTCRLENGAYGGSSAKTYGARGGDDEATQIANEVRRDFIGRQAEGAKKVADGASSVADVIDEQATDAVKYWWLGAASKAGGLAFRWVLGKGKSEIKWANQMAKRGWTDSQINEAVQTKGIPVRNAVNSGNPALRYVHPTTGKSVVIDSKTNEVIHVGGKGFDYSDWDIR